MQSTRQSHGWRKLYETQQPPLVQSWLGPREWLSSGPLPQETKTAIVSSRLPRTLNPHGPWLQALRAALERVLSRHRLLVIAPGSAGHELILRGAERLAVPTVLVHCWDRCVQSDAYWQRELEQSLGSAPRRHQTELWALAGQSTDSGNTQQQELRTTPERDRAAIAWGEEVIVLGLRLGGNIHKLLKRRLADASGSVCIIDLPHLQSRTVRREMLELGAMLWNPLSTSSTPVFFQSSATSAQIAIAPHAATGLQAPIEFSRDDNHREFLTHTTRACSGPWPNQSHQDYWDSLLDARPDSDHSPLAALTRIVVQRRLIASSQAIRGGYGVVCFTAVPVWELPRLRTFRSHRGRWDFEPYGICIRRDWLQSRGARPVRYGDESVWNELEPGERAYFQCLRQPTRTSDPAKPVISKPVIDWSIEQEWRMVGDLDLSTLSEREGFVFVASIEEAVRLRPISPWPVAVLR